MNRTIDAGQPGGTDSPANRRAASTIDLVRVAVKQFRRLAHAELRLARAELTARARTVGVAAGLFGGAGILAGYGTAAVLLTLVALLALAVPAWAAALIVTVVLIAVAALLAAVGGGQLRRVGSIVPKETVGSVKADLRTVSRAAKRRRQR